MTKEKKRNEIEEVFLKVEGKLIPLEGIQFFDNPEDFIEHHKSLDKKGWSNPPSESEIRSWFPKKS